MSSIMPRLRNPFRGISLALAFTAIVLFQVACTSAQVKNILSQVNQYMPTVLSVATDIIAMLPLLTSQVGAAESASYVKDAQSFSDAVGLISSDVAAYTSSKSSTALAKVADAVNAAKATIGQLLTDIHVTNAALQQKIMAYANLASTVLTTLASIVTAPSVSKAKSLMASAPLTPAAAASRLAVITAMPVS